MRRAVALSIVAAAFVTTVFAQPTVDADRAAGIAAMRAINTAQNAVKQASGKYVSLAHLLDHPAMSRVRADLAVNAGMIVHRGQPIRLSLSTDALQYQAMVVPAETCGTAIFSDERGLIYTGKVLDC